MVKAGRAAALAAVALGAAIGLAGCITTVKEQISAASDKARATEPLVDWIDVLPEHLAEVDPARLQGEGAALLIARSLRETGTGDRDGTPNTLMLRDVTTSTIHVGSLQRTGTDAEIGWSVMIVRPGRYALNRGATLRRTSVHRATGQVRDSVADVKGHPFVPLNATIPVGAGDVLYVGTIVRRSGPNVDPFHAEVRDEHAAAAAWTRERLPAFAPRLQTRLLPRPVKPLS